MNQLICPAATLAINGDLCWGFFFSPFLFLFYALYAFSCYTTTERIVISDLQNKADRYRSGSNVTLHIKSIGCVTVYPIK